MNIDVINLTEEQLQALSYEQRKAVYEAQEKKDERLSQLEEDKEDAKLSLIARGMARSGMLDLVYQKLDDEYAAWEEALVYVLLDTITSLGTSSVSVLSLSAASSEEEETEEEETDGFSYDESLSFSERYEAMKAYFLAVEDPEERYALFLAEDGAEEYLGEYYLTLKEYLQTFL